MPSSVTVGDGPPVLVLAIFPDERVVGLRRADPVVGHLLVVIRRLEVVAWPGFGKPAVKEALAVGVPLGRRELDPLQVVAAVLAGGHVADFPFVPVRPRGGDPVGQQFAVVAHLGSGKGDRTVPG